MIIIVEGPDGSGKTTLLKQLEEKGFKTLPRIPREHIENAELFKSTVRLTHYDIWCLDRCFITELIYRCIKQDKEPTITLKQVVDCLQEFGVLYVFCANRNSYRNAKLRGENYVLDKKEHDAISNAYDFIYNMLDLFTNVNLYKYDYEKDDVNNLINYVKVLYEKDLHGC